MNTYHNYIFLNEINNEIKFKIKKIRKLSIIYFEDNSTVFDKINCKIIRDFCKSIKAPFYVMNCIKRANKYKANGVYISANNKRIILNKSPKLKIIGSTHNNLDYYFKFNQKCTMIMLSPLFYNKKYSYYKILGATKFRLITKNWKTHFCALGGINMNKLNKIKLIKTENIAYRSTIYS
jgi:thiamine monophosphate synthase